MSFSPRDVGQFAAEGLAHGAWIYTEMKKPPEEPKPQLERFTILATDATAEMTAGHTVGAAIGAGQTFTRGLQVLPGNVCTPTFLGKTAEDLAKRYGFDGHGARQGGDRPEKMGALLSIAQGSAEEPRFIVLEYKGSDARAGRAGREGGHVRHRRHLDQAGAEHGGHEVRHVGRGGRARHVRDAGPAQAQGARRGTDPVHREHALGHGGEAGRRDHEPLSARRSR